MTCSQRDKFAQNGKIKKYRVDFTIFYINNIIYSSNFIENMLY